MESKVIHAVFDSPKDRSDVAKKKAEFSKKFNHDFTWDEFLYFVTMNKRLKGK